MAYQPKKLIYGAEGSKERFSKQMEEKQARKEIEQETKNEETPQNTPKAIRGLYQTLDLHGDVATEKIFRHSVRRSNLPKEVQEQVLSAAEPYIEYNKKHNLKLKRKVITRDNLEEVYKKLGDNTRDIVSRKHVETLKRNFGKPADDQAFKKAA